MKRGKHLNYDPMKLSMCDDDCNDRGFNMSAFLVYRSI